MAARCADPAIADDLKYVLATANAMAAGRYQVAYCPSLVRGQGYYTGMVFEVTCPQFSGAVAGGGRYDNMVGKFLGTQVPAVSFSIGFERVCGILLEQGYQIPGAKQKIALLYGKDADFHRRPEQGRCLRDTYNVTVLPQGRSSASSWVSWKQQALPVPPSADKDEVKVFCRSVGLNKPSTALPKSGRVQCFCVYGCRVSRFFGVEVHPLHPGVIKVLVEEDVNRFAGARPLVQASYRASARAEESPMFTAMNTVSTTVIQGRMCFFRFAISFATRG